MPYQVLIGIEHLLTGVQFMPLETGEMPPVFRFERAMNASMVQVTSDAPFEVFWPVQQTVLKAERSERFNGHKTYTEGHVEWYAQVMAQAMKDAESRLFEAQTYARTADFTVEKCQRCGLKENPHCVQHEVKPYPSRLAPTEPPRFPQAVIDAMVTKHGRDAFEFLSQLRWSRDHWYYTHAGMYIGVEPDGYIHT